MGPRLLCEVTLADAKSPSSGMVAFAGDRPADPDRLGTDIPVRYGASRAAVAAIVV
jgi:hypothetical protein